MKAKKWIILAVVIALVVAAVAFLELSGIGRDIAAKREEEKMWKGMGADLVEQISEDAFFAERYGKINSWRIMETSTATASVYNESDSLVILTIYCETDTAVLQVYASKSKNGDENWRYRTESVRLK